MTSPMAEKKTHDNLLAALCLGVVACVIAYFRSRNLDLEAALSGLSPEQIALLTNRPDWFARDFPSGALESLKSTVFQIYPLAYAAGLDITATWAAMILLEIAVMMGAVFFAMRLLFPASGVLLPAGSAIVISTSALLTPDIARFMFPYYGWNYGFASAGLLVSAALCLRGRLTACASIWVLLATIHPIMALFAAIFCGAVILSRWLSSRGPGLRELAAPVAIGVIGGGAWLLWVTGQGTISGGQVDPQWFIALTRAQNYHWYPLNLRIFGEYHHAHFLPLLATMALTAWALGVAARDERPLARDAAAGLAALIAITALGVLISQYVASPVLIKLALHRAGQAAVTIGAVFILHALWRDLTRGEAPERAFAAMLLLLPFQSSVGLVPGLVCARLALAAIRAGRPSAMSPWLLAALALGSLSLGLIAFYWSEGHSAGVPVARYSGITWQLVVAGGVAALWPPACRLLGRLLGQSALAGRRVGEGAALALLAVFALHAAPRFDPMAHGAVRARAQNALSAQLWARDNTAVASLFMVDPSLGYMWRDKSQRPSFGTVREWLLISIMYNSRAELLEEGLRRYEALGVPRPDHLLHSPERFMPNLLGRLQGDAEKAFDRLGRAGFERLAASYGIEYVVFDRRRVKGELPLTIIYENADFAIGRIR
jgi:hypothetical protein